LLSDRAVWLSGIISSEQITLAYTTSPASKMAELNFVKQVNKYAWGKIAMNGLESEKMTRERTPVP